MSNKAPNITTPKGGGAQSGLGEKFSPDLFTGTGNFSVPIAVPPGRNGFQPGLTLGYSSGNGNSAFGMGWNLSVPGISRKTSRGIPVYDDDQDVFILSGAEDLVRIRKIFVDGGSKTYYRPRTEGLYARIIHCKTAQNADYWEVRTKDGLVSYYGNPGEQGTKACVVANPQDRNQIFAWRLFSTENLVGDVIMYSYQRELQTSGIHIYDQLYLSSIKYTLISVGRALDYKFQVNIKYNPRPDPFSEYKQGFEVRTTQRADSIETYVNHSGLIKTKTYDFIYLDETVGAELPLNGASMLAKIIVTGHNGSEVESMPPLTFDYSKFEPLKRDFFQVKGDGMPDVSLASPDLEMVDLTGNGLPDILQLDGVARWWPNTGNGTFGLPRMMKEAPAGLQLADPNVQMIDANGDGRADLLVNRPGFSGYFSTRFGGAWDQKSFVPYEFAPSFSFEDPEVKLMDLDGDGVTDALRNGSSFQCFYNHPQKGFYKTTTVNKKSIDDFPDVSFTDARIRTADMSGDGMQDFVYVHSGKVSYWPNLGYGRFGKKITMKNSPRFPQGYNPKYVMLGDVDGDGLADLLYIDSNKVTLWVNKGGNEWSNPVEISGTPAVTDMDSVRITDLKGSGVAGVLWSSIYGVTGLPKMFFLDFTAGNKPYMLQEMNNNMGSITRVAYTSSTRYFLEDNKKPETRWKTELPFPVLVVSKVEVIDQVSKGKLVTEYSYRHGYWDGTEREFRGFGRVNQRDTETFTAYNNSSLVPLVTPEGLQNFNPVSTTHYSPPTETRTWFHQGPMGDEYGGWYEADFSNEYWTGDKPMLKRGELAAQADMNMFNALPRRAKRDALRTLRGMVLRTELYALDQSPLATKPYTVTETLSFVRKEYEPQTPITDTFHYASGYIFLPFAIAQRTTQWERGNDPMTNFSFTWDYDAYGQARKQLSVAVSRGYDPLTGSQFTAASGMYIPPVLYTSKKYLATFSDTVFNYKGDIDDQGLGGFYFTDRVQQSKGFDCSYSGVAMSVVAFYRSVAAGSNIGPVLSHSFNYYDGLEFDGLALGVMGNYGALVRTESLVVTDSILTAAYGGVPYPLQHSPSWPGEYPSDFIAQVPDRSGYQYYNSAPYTTGFYVQATRNKYDWQIVVSGSRGMIVASKDPFGAVTSIGYDSGEILPVSVTDAESHTVSVEYDYRVLQPYMITDPNNNSSVFDYSPLGLLRATSLIGKGPEGDYKGAGPGYYDNYEPSTKLEYDFLNFVNNGEPIWVKTIKREYHYQQFINDDTIESVEYSDGFGRLVQTRAQAEDMKWGDSTFGSALPPDQGSNDDAIGYERWPSDPLNVVVNGYKVYNNKGKVVEQYEPIFDMGFDFAEVPPTGQKISMYYDPRGQVIRTVNPDMSEQRVLYGIPLQLNTPTVFNPTPWEAYTYDANDLAPLWGGGTSNVPSSHYYTPKSAEVDALGRTIRTMDRLVSDNNTANNVQMLYEYDVRGNLLKVTDAYSRKVFEHIYDLRPPAKEGEAVPPLFTFHINNPEQKVVFDCAGKPVERRDTKRALVLNGYDVLQRPVYNWCRDNDTENATLRHYLEYGYDDVLNTIGKLIKRYDESGLDQVLEYDFKGNALYKKKQVISNDEILNTINNCSAGGWDPMLCYRVDWTGLPHILAPEEYDTDMQYDALNRVRLMLYPEDASAQRKELQPLYNKAGSLRSVWFDSTEYVKEIGYNARGQRLIIAYGNGMMTRYAYNDVTFRLQRMRSEKYTYNQVGNEHIYYYEAGTTRQDFAYTYDLSGNIVSINNETPQCGTNGTDNLERTFDYDAIYRLLGTTGRENQPSVDFPRWDDTTRSDDPNTTTEYKEGYAYDLMGNMQQLAHDGINAFVRTFNYTNNILDSIDVGGNNYYFEYDVCGNQTRQNEERWFQWDYADRLRLFYNQAGPGVEPSIYTHYLYDAGGNRVKKMTWNGGKWETIVYIDGIIEYRQDQDGNLQSISHIMDDNTRIASFTEGYDFGDPTPVVKYYLNDHLGSSNVVVDDVGSVVNIEEYYPFGETSFGSYGKKRYRYCGKEKDEESGLYYYGMRYYVPWACRFVSVDPLASKYPFYTPYQYAGNQPINFIDLDGAEQAPAPSDSTSKPTPAVDSSATQTPVVPPNAGIDSVATSIDTLSTAPRAAPTDSVQKAKAPIVSSKPVLPEKKVPTIKMDFSMQTLPGEGVQSTDYQLYAPQNVMPLKPKTVVKDGEGVSNVSQQGIDFIASWEQGPGGGPALKVYKDDGGYPTIGWGHLLKKGESFTWGITKDEAMTLLQKDVQVAVDLINENVKVPLNQNQFDALTAYVYNTGSLVGTQLLAKLNAGKYDEAVKEMDIITSNGQVLQGLINRRSDEQNIFNNGVYKMHK